MNDEKQEINLDESNGKRLVSEKLEVGYPEYVMGRRYQQTSRFSNQAVTVKGTEKILDLACEFGRHSLEFARRGYDVTGIDITPAYIDYANEQAKKKI